MNTMMEDKLFTLAQQYNIDSAMLKNYAETGCKICYKVDLTQYILDSENQLNSESEMEEFLEIVIATGMAERLHDIVNASPFKKFRFPKP